MGKQIKPYYRRRLPHWQPDKAMIFFTWRLYGSLPAEVLERLTAERDRLRRQPERPGESERARSVRESKIIFGLLDKALNQADRGPMWLKNPRLAELVMDALFHHAGKWYDLLAFVVMSNHVHVLLTPLDQPGEAVPYPISQITQGIKGYTAREANRFLGRTGQPFWQDESYDHWARDAGEVLRIIAYIESDPVRAGLVAEPEEWRWSSAWERLWGRLVGQTF
jgi:putative transposase